ncbi:alpha/beta hydrolase [Saccharopolyspora sp. K220]|uniref:alpha/beta fold hydrolase n=1 Tax=Saccharopolyspora soli TaxID=2926618 RepID=UPI001F589792|nr:alpha/beta hydrolase [Saccharopolyspora soli]MCI2422944.1 alpha/beta hydrolase [Saccharopolyspora soli]
MTGQFNGDIATNDGVRIRYTMAGSGAVLVMIPGFSQSAAEFGKQIDELSHDYRVIAMDLRGHGNSDKPSHGYRVSRLAADLRDLLEALDLSEVTLVGHSLGCTVIWSYWDLFGSERISRLVLVDQAAIAAAELAPPGRAEELGAIFTHEMATGIVAGLRGPNPATAWKPTLDMMHGPSLSGEDLAWISDQNALLPPEHAATLYLDHYGNDWRDVLPRITVPTLVIGGEASFFATSVAEWVASQIPDARLRIFSEAEHGSHLVFWENPELFNSVIRQFLTDAYR